MDEALLDHWLAHPKTLPEWNEALLAYKRCVESLPEGSDARVSADMLSAKKKFQREAQEVRTPARVLFSKEEDEMEEFVNVTEAVAISPYKPSLSLLGSTKFSDGEKHLARHIKRVESGLESATHNLILHRTVMDGHDSIMRGLESRLDTVQDQMGANPLGLSAEFEAPTLNGRVAVLAERISSFTPSSLNVSEPKVLALVKQWWEKSEMKNQISHADEFSNACEVFLTELVTKVNDQVDKVTTLQTQVTHLCSASILEAEPPQAPSDASTFTTLSQSLGMGPNATGTGPLPHVTQAAPMPEGSPAALQESMAALEQKVNDLTAKLVKLGSPETTATVKFGGAGFSSP
jgi:hypothetical protein